MGPWLPTRSAGLQAPAVSNCLVRDGELRSSTKKSEYRRHYLYVHSTDPLTPRRALESRQKARFNLTPSPKSPLSLCAMSLGRSWAWFPSSFPISRNQRGAHGANGSRLQLATNQGGRLALSGKCT